jgi:hypothetical protein
MRKVMAVEWMTLDGVVPPWAIGTRLGTAVSNTVGGTFPYSGFIQASDRLEGDFTEQDEANLVRLARSSRRHDALAQLHLPDYRRKVSGGRLSKVAESIELATASRMWGGVSAACSWA